MAILARLLVLLPLALSIVGLVLSALALFAGREAGFMEDYAIARVNVSMIGQDMFQSDSDDTSDEDDGDGGFLDDIGDAINDVGDGIIDQVNDIVGDAAEDIADAIGIQDWYSIHVMNACEGTYKPNATASSPGLNVSTCTRSSPDYRLNLTDIINEELSVGPFDINLNDLGWTDEIQDKIDIVNDLLLGLFILYVLGMGFSGLGVLGSIAAGILPSKAMSLLNMLIALLATLSLLVASIMDTVAITRGFDEINNVANDVGVYVGGGRRFLTISWVSAVALLIATVFWIIFFVGQKKRDTRVRRSKETY